MMSNIESKGIAIIKMTKRLQKIVDANMLRKAKKHGALPSSVAPGTPAVITSKHKAKDYFLDQTYNGPVIPSLTKGWQSDKAKGDSFVIHATSENPAFIQTDDTTTTFEDLCIDDQLIENLKNNNISKPTNIQAKAIPHILSGNNTIISAETGNGKTYSYIIPILQSVLLNRSNMEQQRPTRSPLALIVVPTRELAHQVKDMTRIICEDLDVKCSAYLGRDVYSSVKNKQFDIIISTAGGLSRLLRTDLISTDEVKHIVLDEVDTLFDASFSNLTKYILQKFAFKGNAIDVLNPVGDRSQLIMVGATLPGNFEEFLDELINMKSVTRVQTEYLHKLPSHITHKFFRVGASLKHEKLIYWAKNSYRTGTPTIIFCNKSAKARYVQHALNEVNISTSLLCSTMNNETRRREFMNFKDGKTTILVTTDLGSRGIDTPQVQRVINYEFPSFMSDYIHRSGRTGRVGSAKTAEVINFVSVYGQHLVQQIERAVRCRTLLPNVNSNIKEFFNKRAEYKAREIRTEERKAKKEDLKLTEESL